MAVPPNLVQIAFAGGIDESIEDEILDPNASFAVLENGRQDKTGGYAKRLGYEAITRQRLDGSTRDSGYRQFTDGDTPCIINGATVESYSPTLNRWVSHSTRPSEATYSFLGIPTLGLTGGDQLTVIGDTDCVNGYIIVAYYVLSNTSSASSMAFVAVLDATNGAIVRAPQFLANSVSLNAVKLASYANTCIAVVGDGDADTIQGWYIEFDDATAIQSGWVALGANIASDYDADALAVGSYDDRIAVAYGNGSGGANRVTVKTVKSTGVVSSTTINTSSVDPSGQGLAVADGSEFVWVGWNQTTTCNAIGLSPTTLAITSTAVTMFTTTGTDPSLNMTRLNATAAILSASDTAASYIRIVLESSGTSFPDGDGLYSRNAILQSRPFYRGGLLYGMFSSLNYDDAVLCECPLGSEDADGDTVAVYLRPVAAPVARGLYATSFYSARVAAIDANRFAFAFMTKRTGTTTACNLVVFDFADRERWSSAQHNSTLYLGSGLLMEWDGLRPSEAGFVCAPPIPTTDISNAGSLTLTLGRRYVAVYVDVDARGNTHISGVSNPSESTGAFTSKKVYVTTEPLSITARDPGLGRIQSALQTWLYGTTDGGEPPYYFVGAKANGPGTTETFIDETDDLQLVSQALLYGSGNLPGTVVDGQPGGPQDHRSPPGLMFPTAYNGMLVGASGSDVWFSAQQVIGEGTWFSPLFSVPINEPITGLAAQDGTLFVFTRAAIFAVSGDPPSDNGTQGGLGTPRKLSVDNGCINSTSIVVTSMGVFFQSDRGIELLSRSGAVTWIGQQVQRTTALYPVITSATLDTRNSLVRFSLATDVADGLVTGEGRDVIYDLTLGIWIARDSKIGQIANETSQDAGMIYYGGVWRYSWLGTDGYLYAEKLSTSATAHLDGALWVTRRAETGWFKASGIQGVQQVNKAMVLERKSTGHDLSVALGYNYDTEYKTPRVWTASEIDGLLSDGWPITQLKHEPHDDSVCQGFRVKITDATPTPYLNDAETEIVLDVDSGAGSTWLALTLDVTPKPGVFDVPEEAA